MRILQLCKKFPFPLKDGESIAVTHLSKAINDLGCEVTLLSMNTSKHHCDVKNLPEDFNHYKKIHHVEVDNKVQLWDAFVNLFSKESYHITRFLSAAFEKKLVQVLKNNTFDVVQLETPVLSPYIPLIRKHSDALIAMRSHNVEHEIWERMATNHRFYPVRWYFRQAAEKLKQFELKYLNQYDLVLAITHRDLNLLKKMGLKKPSAVIPIGLDINDYHPAPENMEKSVSLSFIGSLDWLPNQEGLRWFLENVWDELKSRFDDLSLHVAGRNTPAWVSGLKKDGVVVHGEIGNSLEFISSHDMMIVPLFSGSGMRVKILEGMALGKTVISTSIGLEGIEAKDGEEVLIANSVEAFVRHVEMCIKKRNIIASIGGKARDLVASNYDNLRIARKLLQFYHHQIHGQPVPADSMKES